MKTIAALIVPLVALLCFGAISQCLGQTRGPGVLPGDAFSYDIKGYWSSTNSSFTPPAYLLELNKTAYFNVTVSSVQGMNVTARNDWRFLNGTELNSLTTIDVDTGELLFYIPERPAFQGFYDANLSANDRWRPSNENDTVTINQTIPIEYANEKRDTNIVTITDILVTNYSNSTNGTESLTYKFDKATGVLVEKNIYTQFPEENGTEQWHLTKTSVWTVSSTPFPVPLPVLVAIVIVIVVAVAVVGYMRLNRGRKKKTSRFRRH